MRFLRIIAGLLAVALIVALAWPLLERQWAAHKTRGEKAVAAKETGEHVQMLLKYFREMPEEELAPGYAEHKVRELGSKRFAVREAASKTLVRMSWRAAVALRRARGDRDPEIRRRVAECLTRIQEKRTWYQEYDWVRELMGSSPRGLNEVLLHFLPFAADDDTETLVYLAVYERCKKHPTERPALEPYLADQQDARRALAALVLGRQGTPAQQAMVRELLVDAEPIVRLRAAQGLLAAHDKTAIPALIGLLPGSPHPLDWEATELLHWAAGCNSNDANPLGRPGPPGATLYERWRLWWASIGPSYRWPTAPEPVQCPRLLLVTQNPSPSAPHHGRVWLSGGNGEPLWEFTADRVGQAAMLRDGNVLVTVGNQLSKRTPTGRTLWQVPMKGHGPWPFDDVRPEPDGTTTILVGGPDRALVYSLGDGDCPTEARLSEMGVGGWFDEGARISPFVLVRDQVILGRGTSGRQPAVWRCDLSHPYGPARTLLPMGLLATWQDVQRSRHDLLLLGDNQAWEWDGYRADQGRPPDRAWTSDSPFAAESWDAAQWSPVSGLVVFGSAAVAEINGAGHRVWQIRPGEMLREATPVCGAIRIGFHDGDWSHYLCARPPSGLAWLRLDDPGLRHGGLAELRTLRARGANIDAALPSLAGLLAEAGPLAGAAGDLLRSEERKSLPYLFPLARHSHSAQARVGALLLVPHCKAARYELQHALIFGLYDPSPAVQTAAACIVAGCGRAGAYAQDRLTDMVKAGFRTGDAPQADAAARALGAVAGDKVAAETVLREGLSDDVRPRLRKACEEGLRLLGARGRRPAGKPSAR